MPQCYEKLLLCNFKSTFDTYESPMAPWRAAQRVGVSVLSKRPVDTRTALAQIPPAPTQQEVADAIEAVPLRRGERFCMHHHPDKFTGVRCAGVKKHGKGQCRVCSGSLYADAANFADR